MVLQAFAPGIRAELPFLMPTVAGTVRQGALTTFVYSHLAGSTKSVEELSSGSDVLANEIGSALGAIHDLPHSLVRNADLPSYTPNEFRQRRLNELDQAATTGKIPAVLLRRWEHALEDVSLWRFNPCVVHGDLHEDNLLVEGRRVTAVTGWTDLRIGDPADDMAWLVASNEQSFVDAVLRHYTEARRDSPDSHLLRRAALSAEFALAQYLVKAVATGDGNMISEAEEMLSALADDIVQHGGQPISVEPLPQAAGAPSATAGIGAAQEPPGSSPSSFIGGPIPPGIPAVHVAPIPTEDVVSVQETSQQTEQVEEPKGDGPTDPDGLDNGVGHNNDASHNNGEGHNDAGHNYVAGPKTGDAPNSSDAAGSGPARNLGESHDDTSTAALQIIDQKTS